MFLGNIVCCSVIVNTHQRGKQYLLVTEALTLIHEPVRREATLVIENKKVI